MRLGFDLDGTLADLQGALAREALTLFPDVDPESLPRSASPESEPPSSPGAAQDQDNAGVSISALAPHKQRMLWAEVCARTNFWETLDEIEPGALGRLYDLASVGGWEVIFLTSRPETAGDTAQNQSHRWLTARGFLTPSVFVVHGSRGKIAEALALDMLVDDRPENCLDVALDSKARPILVWRDEGKVPSSARRLGIGAVTSIAQCLDILESIHRGHSDQPGVVDRVKRLLGLTPQPAQAGTAEARPLLARATTGQRR